MDTQRFVMCSSRGVQQVVAFDLLPCDGGFSVRSRVLIKGCLPRPGQCFSTPLSRENAIKWIHSQSAKLARSPAAFQPVQNFEQRIEALFFEPGDQND